MGGGIRRGPSYAALRDPEARDAYAQDRGKRPDDGLEHCPDCGGLMTSTMNPKQIMCSDCGAIFELGRAKKRRLS